MTAFFGSFHPLIVHLPIGILLMALLFELMSGFQQFRQLESAVAPLFLFAAISAIAACITGFWLSASGEYDATILNRHKWVGIWTALVTSVAWVLKKDNIRFAGWRLVYKSFCILLLVLITFAGHLGGTLTHGSGFLTKNLPEPVKSSLGIKSNSLIETPVEDVQEAKLYGDLVARVLQKKCIGCHGPEKQKGRLRLDAQEYILKGGKDGVVIKAGNVLNSELMKRLLLPLDNEDHMPPKEKQQLTTEELALLHFWISSGADFTKAVKDFSQNDSVKAMLLTFQADQQKTEKGDLLLPQIPVEAAASTLLDSIRQLQIIIQKIDPKSNYLTANFINSAGSADSSLRLLTAISKQLLVLNLTNKILEDSSMHYLSELNQLRRLNLKGTNLTDTLIEKLNSLKNLEYLNLVGTSVSVSGLEKLTELKSLKSVFLYQTLVVSTDYEKITGLFPKAVVDTGGYLVPTLQSDTTIFKAPKKKKAD